MSDARPFALSVVIPNRNRARGPVRAALSVLEQTPEPVEIILIDDASSEDMSRPYGILEGLGARIVRLPERRRGAVARNLGTNLSSGSHVSFLDSDDVWLPGRYDRIRAFAERPGSSAKVLVSGLVLHRSGEFRPVQQPPWPPGRSLVEYVYRDAGRVQTSMLTLPMAVARNYPFDEDLWVNQDTDLAMRLDQAAIGFVIDDEPGVVKEESDIADRLTKDPEMADRSLEWFNRVSGSWPRAAVQGFHLQDRSWRLLDAGRPVAAMVSLLRANLPPYDLRASGRQGLEIVLGRRRYAAARRTYRRLGPKRAAVESGGPAAQWWHRLDSRARDLIGEARDGMQT